MFSQGLRVLPHPSVFLIQGFFQNHASSLGYSPRTQQPGTAQGLHYMEQCPASGALEGQFCGVPETPRPSCPQLNNTPFVGFLPSKTRLPCFLSSASRGVLPIKTPAPMSLSQDPFSEELEPGHIHTVASPLYLLQESLTDLSPRPT